MQPLKIIAKAAGTPEEWRSNIRSALGRNLPSVSAGAPNSETLVVVGSGPSIAKHLQDIRDDYDAGLTIVAVKGSHDWLIERGIYPHWYVNLDPRDRTEHLKHAYTGCEYFICSRCPPVTFDFLLDKGCPVTVWNSYEEECETWPELKGQNVIQGGTTSGLRAINLGHVQGYRKFRLYGFDSCLADDGTTKRITGETVEADKVIECVLNGEKFQTSGALAQQAEDFRGYVSAMTDSQFEFRGRSMLKAMYDSIKNPPPMLMRLPEQSTGKSVMFCHPGGDQMASYRMRVAIPMSQLKNWECTVNQGQPDILVVSKPWPDMVPGIEAAKNVGIKVVADFCDDHFDHPHLGALYRDTARLADRLVASTTVLAARIKAATGRDAAVIGDPIEFERTAPHVDRLRGVWFGAWQNMQTMQRFWPYLYKYLDDVVVVTEGNNGMPHVPWSEINLERELSRSSVALLPGKVGHEYKSANRLCNALAKGCFAAIEPHPAYEPWKHLLIQGGVLDGLRWMKANRDEANERVQEAQDIAFKLYSRETIGSLWDEVLTSL